MTLSLSPPTHHTYHWGAVKPWVANAGNILGPLFNINTIGGVRQDPLPDHPSGHALDFMITQPNTPAGVAQGNALANFAVQHYRELGIKYIIWNRQYWDPQQGWGPYTAPSVIAYNPHTNHVHITFNDAPGAWTSSAANATLAANMSPVPEPGGLGAPPSTPGNTDQPSDTCAIPINLPLVGSGCLFSKEQLGIFMGGLLMASAAVLMAVGLSVIAVFAFGSSAASAVGLSQKVPKFSTVTGRVPT
jgi:hypothetical protein